MSMLERSMSTTSRPVSLKEYQESHIEPVFIAVSNLVWFGVRIKNILLKISRKFIAAF
jgi:hypothetical protein